MRHCYVCERLPERERERKGEGVINGEREREGVKDRVRKGE